MLNIGDKAPEFTLSDKNGKTVSLSDFAGRYVALYFYPKDNTSGCTIQAEGYRDSFDDFIKEGAAVIGVSKDSAASHMRFAEKYSLPFIMLSDPDKKVLQLYGVWKEKTMYGRKVMGTVRSSFLIGPDGKIVLAVSPAKPVGNAAEMLEALRKDKKANK